MAITPQQAAAKWARNLGSAGTSMREGIERVTESPTEKAAQAVDRYVSGIQEAVTSGKYQAGLRRTSLGMWKQAALEKGVSRATGAAAGAQPKVEAFMQELLPFVDQAVQGLPPRGGFEENLNRMTAFARRMKEFRRTR